MSERLPLGQTYCDFIDHTEWVSLCNNWLNVDNIHHIVTLNPEMVIEAEYNQQFRDAINKAEIRVPDGAGLIWARWFLRSNFWALYPSLIAFSLKKTSRITGVEAVLDLTRIATDNNKSIYLLGGQEKEVKKTSQLLQEKYPEVKIFSASNHLFDLSGPQKLIDDINNSRATILLVAYGAPKQSLWIEKNRDQLRSVRIAIGVGGAFDILSETKTRAPKIFRRFNLEWLWRLIIEPSRLPRIWKAVIKFPRIIKTQKNNLVPK